MAEVFEYELRGKDTSFGNTVKNAAKAVGELKSAGAQVLASFTGGLLGGGIAQSVLSTVNLIRDVIREARQLQVNAERLGISKKEARGFANLETALDLGQGTFGNIAGAVENAVQEALQGNAEMGRQFGALGLQAQDLEGLSKVEQMFRVMEAYRASGSGPEQRFAFRQLVGSGAEAIEPYALGGKQSLDLRNLVEELSRLQTNETLRWLEGNSAIAASISPENQAAYQMFRQLRSVDDRQAFRADLGGFSSFGLDRGRRLSRVDENLAAQVRQLDRQSLSAEEQLNSIIRERARLYKDIREAKDPEKQRQLIGQELNLAMQEEQLRQRAGGAGLAVKGISRDMDQIARAGFFRGGTPDIATETMRKQLVQLERISALLKSLPPEIARTL